MAKPPKFIQPANTLKAKVGSGGIPADVLKKCQDYMDSNPVDFTPQALDFLGQLKALDTSIRTISAEEDAEPILEKTVNIIMQLKSNGSMFHYQLVTMTSDVILRFLEKVETINEYFQEIMDVYKKVLTIILQKKLTGDGGREGYLLTEELHNACMRYYKRHGIDPA